MQIFPENLLIRRYAIQSELWGLRREQGQLERQLARAFEALRGINKNVDSQGRLTKPALKQTIRWGEEIDYAKERNADLERQIDAKRQELIKVEENLRGAFSSFGKFSLLQDAQSELASMKAIVEDKPAPPSHNYAYDLFISHASEDKDAVVRPLVKCLRDLSLRVWYDESEIKVGDGIRPSIDYGLANSLFGVLVLSPNFISKQKWPAYEFDSLFIREIERGKVILPLWHKVTKDEVMQFNLKMADKLALNTATTTISDIALEIAIEVTEKPKNLTVRPPIPA